MRNKSLANLFAITITLQDSHFRSLKKTPKNPKKLYSIIHIKLTVKRWKPCPSENKYNSQWLNYHHDFILNLSSGFLNTSYSYISPVSWPFSLIKLDHILTELKQNLSKFLTIHPKPGVFPVIQPWIPLRKVLPCTFGYLVLFSLGLCCKIKESTELMHRHPNTIYHHHHQTNQRYTEQPQEEATFSFNEVT